MHIVNHLYLKIRESGGKKPNSDIWKRFCQPGNSHCDSLQKPWWLSDFFFLSFVFAIFLHILLKNLKRKGKKKTDFSVGSFIDLSDFDLLPLHYSTEHSQVKVDVWKKKNGAKLHMHEARSPDRLHFTSTSLIITFSQSGSSFVITCLKCFYSF